MSDEHGGQHGVLGGEVLVERRTGDPARPPDLADRDAVEALGREQLGRGLEDLLPPAHAARLAVVNAARWSQPRVGRVMMLRHRSSTQEGRHANHRRVRGAPCRRRRSRSPSSPPPRTVDDRRSAGVGRSRAASSHVTSVAGAPGRTGRDHQVRPGPGRGGLPRRDGVGARRLVGRARERVRRGVGVRRRPLRHRHRDHLVGPGDPPVRPRLAARRAGTRCGCTTPTHRSRSQAGVARLNGHQVPDGGRRPARSTPPRGTRRCSTAGTSPALGGRFQNNRTDTPLVAWHEVLPAATPGHSVIEYSVIWSNEDGGTEHPGADGAVGPDHRHRVGLPGRGRRPGPSGAGHRRVPGAGPRDADLPRPVRRHPPAAPDLHLQQQRVRQGRRPRCASRSPPATCCRPASRASTRWTSTRGPTR